MARLPDGHWRYDAATREWVRLGEVRRLHNVVEGEMVFCARGGETVDFGKGPVFVRDSFEKARVMRESGVMQHPGGRFHTAGYDPAKMPSFSEHFYKEHGMPLTEATGLVHLRDA